MLSTKPVHKGSMIALGGPKLKLLSAGVFTQRAWKVSMIALGGPKLKPLIALMSRSTLSVSMIALGGPKLKLRYPGKCPQITFSFNDSTGWA